MAQDITFALGGQRSPSDYRDVKLSQLGTATALPLSYFIDISKLPVWNQHQLGACGGHAEGKYRQKEVSKDNLVPLSARFLYAVAKCIDGTRGEGTWSRVLMKVAQDYGCATEATMVNDTTLDHDAYVYNFNLTNIPPAALVEALNYKIKSYAFADMSEDGLKQAIIQGEGAFLLAKVGSNWFTANGYIPPITDVAGNHFIYLYGYETEGDRTKFHILNSWGPGWSQNGTGWFYFDEQPLCLIECATNVNLDDTILAHLHTLPSQADFKWTFTKDQSPNLPDANGEITSNDNDPNEVTALQIALAILGFFSQVTDPLACGFYSSQTQGSVMDFQRAKALPATGILDEATRTVLNSLF